MKPWPWPIVCLCLLSLVIGAVVTECRTGGFQRRGINRNVRVLGERESGGYRYTDFGYSENGSNVVLWTRQHPLR